MLSTQMYHPICLAELEITSKMDFVVPLKRVGLITRAVFESIHLLYRPRRIIVVSVRSERDILESLISSWAVGIVDFIDEELFFQRNFNLTTCDIIKQYDKSRDGDQREPGWWIQQLIKLGAASQIPDLSEDYVVWDGDLIPTRRWRLARYDGNGRIHYYIAILQAEARSEFNTSQYASCMKAMLGYSPLDPEGGGTFVAHHMIFNKQCVTEMINSIISFTGSTLPWPLLIMSYSRIYYRFSEYKTYATFMIRNYPERFEYHPLADFGECGIRFRDAGPVLKDIITTTCHQHHDDHCNDPNSDDFSCGFVESKSNVTHVDTDNSNNFVSERKEKDNLKSTLATGLSYERVRDYTLMKWNLTNQVPGYIQLDHVYSFDVDLTDGEVVASDACDVTASPPPFTTSSLSPSSASSPSISSSTASEILSTVRVVENESKIYHKTIQLLIASYVYGKLVSMAKINLDDMKLMVEALLSDIKSLFKVICVGNSQNLLAVLFVIIVVCKVV